LRTVKAMDEEIKVFSAPCFIATKFEAFHARGKEDYFKEDFEDIIYILDNRESIVAEIANAENEIKDYLTSEFKQIWKIRNSEEILSLHIHPLMMEERLPLLAKKIFQIINL